MAAAFLGEAALGAEFVVLFANFRVALKNRVDRAREFKPFLKNGFIAHKLNPTLKNAIDRARMFKPILKRLEYLDCLAPMIEDVKLLDCLGREETLGLIKQMRMFEELVLRKLFEYPHWALIRLIKYNDKLIMLLDSILRFYQVDLRILPIIGAQIWKTVKMHCPGFEFTVQGKSILPRPLGAAAPSPSASITQPIEILVSLPINSQWQRGSHIGRGSFGSVYIATNRNTQALCAIKEVEIFPDDENSAVSIKHLWQEIKLLSMLKHPNIVQYYGSEIVDSWFRIYLEYVPGGSIKKYINDNGAIPESDVRRFTTHILSGLDYLHGKNIVHRDIKGANLLIDSYEVVRLADFGTAKRLALHADATKLYFIGTAHWTAPELVRGLEPSSPDAVLAVDIWSVGCTVLEMLTGRLPWGNLEWQKVLWKLSQGNTPPIPETLSSKVKDFLQCCLQIDPVDRPSAAQLLEHTFLKN